MNQGEHGVAAYLKTFLDGRGRAVSLVLGLLVVLGLMEGIGLVMLLPLLEQFGISGGGPASRGLAAYVSRVFEAVALAPTLPVLLCIYVVLIALRALLWRWETVTISEIQHGFVTQLRNRFFQAVTSANWLFFTRRKSAEFTQILSVELNRVGQGTYYLVQMVSTALITVVYVLIALKLSPLMAVISFVCAGLLLWLLSGQNHKVRIAGEALTRNQGVFFNAITEHLGSLKLVKSYGAEHKHLRRFESITGEIHQQSMNFLRHHAHTKMLFEMGAGLALSGVLLIAVMVLRVPIAELILLVVIYARLLPKFSEMQRSYQQMVHMIPAFAAAETMRTRCEAEAERRGREVGPPPSMASGIAFQSVTFDYGPEGERPVLKDVDLWIPARKTTAIVGPSGSGKTTVADLLMGLMQPTRGALLLDGKPLRASSPAWRGTIGYVPQETFLFHDTIRANLVWVQPGTDEATLWRVLEQAAARDFVTALPQGLDTVIGDRGVRLSGGERQRLNLARALLREPRLLILDEATSALDIENERQIQQAIAKLHGDLTIVIIAHRLSTVTAADRLLIMENGAFVEQGAWRELKANPASRIHRLLGDVKATERNLAPG